jgi:putative transposase
MALLAHIRSAYALSISMSGKGNCFDDAMVETFLKTLKPELVWRTIFQSRIEAANAIGVTSTASPIPSAAIRRSTSPTRFSSKAGSVKSKRSPQMPGKSSAKLS